MRGESNSETSYHWLCELAVNLKHSNSYPRPRSSHSGGSIVVSLDVLRRDQQQRPDRIGLSQIYCPPGAQRLVTAVLEIQLYHEFEVALALACRDSAGYRSVYDENRQLVAGKLSELNQLLHKWLSSIRHHKLVIEDSPEHPTPLAPPPEREFSLIHKKHL